MYSRSADPRGAAFVILGRVFKQNAYSNILLSNIDKTYNLDRQQQAFLRSLVMGVLEKKLLLDYILDSFISKNPDPDTHILLRIGLYQSLYMDVPPSAACNETVKVANRVLDKSRAGFINAVLRNIGRNGEKVDNLMTTAPTYIKHSVNKEIYDLIHQQYGDITEEIFAAFAQKPPLFLRVNTLKTTLPKLVYRLESEEVACTPVTETAIEVTTGFSTVISLLKEGTFFIQGLGSQLAIAALGATAGQTVIDTCAAPGGKSFGAAIDLQNQGVVHSLDNKSNKLGLISRTARRLSIDIIHPRHHDSTMLIPELQNKADRVICDVPCSGLGVINSKPEIRYKSLQDIDKLILTQRQILAESSKYVTKGGKLLYSTCTINNAENRDIVQDFLDANTHFTLDYDKTFLPYDKTGEGFYYALLNHI